MIFELKWLFIHSISTTSTHYHVGNAVLDDYDYKSMNQLAIIVIQLVQQQAAIAVAARNDKNETYLLFK